MIKLMKKIIMKRITRLALLTAAVILLAGTGYAALMALKPSITTERTILYSYSLSAGGSYEALLIENELYPERVLGEDRIYSRNLIDRLNITFTADYSGNQPSSISGNYSIAVTVQGYQSSNDIRRVIYEHSFPLVENKPIQGENSVEISDTVSLDLSEYKYFADKAEQILNARPERSGKIIFSGVFLAQTEYGEVEEPFSYLIDLPLSSELFSITKEAPISKTDIIAEENDAELRSSLTSAILPLSGSLIILAAILVLIFFTRLPTEEEQYVLNFKAILRKHGSRMAKLNNLPPITVDTQVEIADLASLIKISDERQRPVCYSLNGEGLPVDGLLYVPDDGVHYMLYLKK